MFYIIFVYYIHKCIIYNIVKYICILGRVLRIELFLYSSLYLNVSNMLEQFYTLAYILNKYQELRNASLLNRVHPLIKQICLFPYQNRV